MASLPYPHSSPHTAGLSHSPVWERVYAFGATQITRAFLWLVFPTTLCLAITRQSLWIDEGFSVWFASHKSFHSFISVLVGSPGAAGDPQLIFYLFHIWVWIKIFGQSELALRAANIPFAILFIGTMFWASRRLFWHRNLWVLFCLSPFFWFYLNEARPYAAVLAFSSVSSVALLAYLVDPEAYRKWAPWICLIALLIASGMHILGVLLVPSLFVLVATVLLGNSKIRSDFWRDWSRPALCFLPAFIALGIFYVRVSAYGVNKVDGNPGLKNLAYALYEFTGFAGLGPPRNDMRQNQSLCIFAPYWPLLLLGTVALLWVAFSVLRTRWPSLLKNLFFSIVAGFAVAMMLFVTQHFQALGRHMAAFFPLVLMMLMLRPHRALLSPVQFRRATAAMVALGIIWLVSDLRLVLMDKYEKDSYREACSIALTRVNADGAKILWAADPNTAKYYGLQISQDNNSSAIAANRGMDWPIRERGAGVQNWSYDQAKTYLDAATEPTLLVLSKADSFDRNSAWTTLVQQQHPEKIAQLSAFAIYEWQPKKAARTSSPRNPAS